MIFSSKGIALTDYSVLRGKTWRVSEKITGVRRIFHKSLTGIVTAYSLSGQKDVWLKHITEFLENPNFPCGVFYDTKLVDRISLFNDLETYELESTTKSIVEQKGSKFKQDLMGICFDIFSPGEYVIGYERDALLRSLFEYIPITSPIVMVPIFGTIEGEDIEQINRYMTKVLSFNGDGLVLMDLNSVYIPGKSNSLLKVDNEVMDIDSIYISGRSTPIV